MEDLLAHYRRIVEATQDGIWTIDGQARTTFVNHRMGAMLGYAPEEMRGRSLLDFMDDEWRATAQTLIARRNDGIAEEHEFKFLRKDGSCVCSRAPGRRLLARTRAPALRQLKPAVGAGAGGQRRDRAAGGAGNGVGVPRLGDRDRRMTLVDRSLTQGERSPAVLQQARDARRVLVPREQIDLRRAAAAALPAAVAPVEQHGDVRLQACVAQLLGVGERSLQAEHQLSFGESSLRVVQVHRAIVLGVSPRQRPPERIRYSSPLEAKAASQQGTVRTNLCCCTRPLAERGSAPAARSESDASDQHGHRSTRRQAVYGTA
jgi:PAS domain S-box-containing protein